MRSQPTSLTTLSPYLNIAILYKNIWNLSKIKLHWRISLRSYFFPPNNYRKDFSSILIPSLCKTSFSISFEKFTFAAFSCELDVFFMSEREDKVLQIASVYNWIIILNEAFNIPDCVDKLYGDTDWIPA